MSFLQVSFSKAQRRLGKVGEWNMRKEWKISIAIISTPLTLIFPFFQVKCLCSPRGVKSVNGQKISSITSKYVSEIHTSSISASYNFLISQSGEKLKSHLKFFSVTFILLSWAYFQNFFFFWCFRFSYLWIAYSYPLPTFSTLSF